jgi:ApbE superfamily uncharacterized protein (UPF0280 family)
MIESRPIQGTEIGEAVVLPRSSLRLTARNSDFFFSRVQASLAEANATDLANVRERALRAAAAWQEMYEKAQQFERRQAR